MVSFGIADLIFHHGHGHQVPDDLLSVLRCAHRLRVCSVHRPVGAAGLRADLRAGGSFDHLRGKNPGGQILPNPYGYEQLSVDIVHFQIVVLCLCVCV